VKLDKFIYGTQYYRAPTPLPEEWEEDISRFEELGINAFQIRAQWRKNEPSEGNYCFEDIDRLFDLAKKYNRKVIFKFMLETAPQYIFYKYDGERRDFKGVPIRAGSHGAYYVGGWWPCFDNPYVRERATLFIEECVKRYRDREELLCWNAWNEPRSRPVEDCGCKHSLEKFRQWLKEEYGTIEKFNDFFGVSEESFETIAAPGLAQGYWDLFLFRKWRGTKAIEDLIGWMSSTIKKHDPNHPVMCHIGLSSFGQASLNDVSDDRSIAKTVDFYGSSYYAPHNILTHKDEIFCGMNPDYLRSIDRDFVIHEFYPDWGEWTQPVSVEDLRYKLWTVISRGARGITFWQFRAERVGNENNLAGLTGMDGRFNERTIEAGRIGKIIESNHEIFHSMEVPKADVAILFDFDSSLISRVEDISPVLWSFSDSPDALRYYFQASKGMYELFFDMSVPVDYMDTRDMSKATDYKVIYLPYMSMVKPEVKARLEEFVRAGGILIADEGFGLRQQNTWLNPISPDKSLQSLTPARWVERVRNMGEDHVILPTGKASVMPMKTVFEAPEESVIARYSDGRPAIHEFVCGKGKVLLFGTSIGYSYSKRSEKAWVEWMKRYLENSGIRRNPCDDIERGIYSRKLHTSKGDMIIIFNRSKVEQTVCIPEKGQLRELTGQVTLDDAKGEVVIPPGQVACVICMKGGS